MSLEAQDKEALYLSLFNPASGENSPLFEAFGMKQGKKTKTFGVAIGTDEGLQMDIYKILSETFKWFPPKPEPDVK